MKRKSKVIRCKGCGKVALRKVDKRLMKDYPWCEDCMDAAKDFEEIDRVVAAQPNVLSKLEVMNSFINSYIKT